MKTFEEAWKYMEERGIPVGKRFAIRDIIAKQYENRFPYVERKHDGFYNTLDEIRFMIFENEEEANLATAMALLVIETRGKLDKNDFMWQFKAVLRILGIESNWSK